MNSKLNAVIFAKHGGWDDEDGSRAEDVREIVERVFTGYVDRSRRTEAARTKRADAAFPRLYEPVAAGRSARSSFREAIYDHEEAFDGRSNRRFDDGDAECNTLPFSREIASPGLSSRRLEIDETILIDEGRYVARSYRTEGYLAMWLVAVGIVQFYDDGGNMLATVNLFQTLRPKRMAA